MKKKYYQQFFDWCLKHDVTVTYAGLECCVFLIEEHSKEFLFLICHFIREMQLNQIGCEIAFQVDYEGRTSFVLNYDEMFVQLLVSFLLGENYPFVNYSDYVSLLDVLERLALYSPFVFCQIYDCSGKKYVFYADSSFFDLNLISPFYLWNMNCNILVNDPMHSTVEEVFCAVLSVSSDEEIEEYSKLLDTHIELRKTRHEFQ